MTSRSLKGITVEIDGSTTGLQSALKEVNTQIKNTQSQLKDVEKLLKLDPSNTELLAQKQRLLTDAIKETKEKLDTLKTAADFESSMSPVQATMGITADSMSEVDGQTVNTMDTLSALAKEMGTTTAFSATECTEALNYLALAGYDTQQMCDTLPTVLNLAAAGGFDLATASDMVTDAMCWIQTITREMR